MSQNIYDPRYETNVPCFNKTQVKAFVLNNEVNKVRHWLANGRPHKRLAGEAMYEAIHQDNAEIIDLVYQSGWVSKEKFLFEVLGKCEVRYTQDDEKKEYYPQVREWAAKTLMAEIDRKSLKDKVSKELVFMLSKTNSDEDARKIGIDYTIKMAREEAQSIGIGLLWNLKLVDEGVRDRAKKGLEGNVKAKKQSMDYFETLLFMVERGTPMPTNLLKAIVMYGNRLGFDFVKPYSEKLFSLDSVVIDSLKNVGLLVTELGVWQEDKCISLEDVGRMLSLLIKSGLKNTVVIKRKDVMIDEETGKEAEHYDYFEVRRGVVGSVERVNSVRQNCRPNQNVFYEHGFLSKGDNNDEVVIDIREYVFIDHDDTSIYKTRPVTEAEKQASIAEFEALRVK